MNCGASGGQAIAHVTDQTVVGLVGDSTFFHSGVAPLVNAVQNEADLLLLVLDNSWVSMTGHQPSPTTSRLVDGSKRDGIDLVGFVKALGVPWVRRADPFHPVALENLLRDALKGRGVRVVVVEGECALQTEKRRKHIPPGFEEYVDLDAERCQRCHRCYRDFACPAIREVTVADAEPYYAIDEALCQRCGVCETICPNSAITTTLVKRRAAS
jgi:indolepyruvate ferredoxin oxidoreductase alpha subunit